MSLCSTFPPESDTNDNSASLLQHSHISLLSFPLFQWWSVASVSLDLMTETYGLQTKADKSCNFVCAQGRGCTLWCALGSVNMRRKNCVLLPAAGRRTQLFHLIFTQPGAYLLEHPCMSQKRFALTDCPYLDLK